MTISMRGSTWKKIHTNDIVAAVVMMRSGDSYDGVILVWDVSQDDDNRDDQNQGPGC